VERRCGLGGTGGAASGTWSRDASPPPGRAARIRWYASRSDGTDAGGVIREAHRSST
jgi:hypothetical protein